MSIFLVIMSGILAAGAGLSGHVVGRDGVPLAGAHVFLQEGPGEAVRAAMTDADGGFAFENVAPGLVGVFAIGKGYSFGGMSIFLALGERQEDLVIELRAPRSVRGLITDVGGRPVEGAQVTPLLIMDGAKVGIPWGELATLGFQPPTSDAEGRLTVPLLPEGAAVTLKVSHPLYAQTVVTDIAVGREDVQATLSKGVLVEGDVLARPNNVPVVNVTVTIANAQPPHDTVLAKTSRAGAFAVRLNPGVYLCRAKSAELGSPSWTRLNVSGEVPSQRVTLRVAPMGRLRGKVCDVVTGQPIAGAKLSLEMLGMASAVMRTGPTGEYEFSAAQGANRVTLESAPGYAAPDSTGVSVDVAAGRDTEVPTFWLVPTPTCLLQVLDGNQAPVPGAAVSLFRPVQFEWRITDKEGQVRLDVGALPPDGIVVGMAEHVSEPFGALFAVKFSENREAKVQLLPLGSVRGRVVSQRGEPLPGAVVGAILAAEVSGLTQGSPGDSADGVSESLVFWRTLSRRDGTFEWTSVVPYVPLQCVAQTGGDKSGISDAFHIAARASHDVGDIVVEDGMARASVQGKTLAWYENRLLCGKLPSKAVREGKPAAVIYCRPGEARMVIKAAESAQEKMSNRVLFAVVVEGVFVCEEAAIPVLTGRAPAPATTYLIGRDGRVTFETFGMPPLAALHRLAGQGAEKGGR